MHVHVHQVTVFVALLSLDARRMEQRRMDCAPCVRLPQGRQRAARQRSYGGVLEEPLMPVGGGAAGEDAAPELKVGGGLTVWRGRGLTVVDFGGPHT